MVTVTRRVTFNIKNFLQDLMNSLVDRPDLIDDTVQTYKDYLSRADEGIKNNVKDYVNTHPLVLENQELRSYIEVCHR